MKFWLWRLRLTIGIGLYFIAAVADGYMTLQGMQGDLALEGSPLMRETMRAFGPAAGLVIQKFSTLVLTTAVAVLGERAITARRPWVYRLALTRWTKAWMQRKDRQWVAYLPLYLAAMGQVIAAMSWGLIGQSS